MTYNGNPNLSRIHETQSLTQDQVEEYIKCADPVNGPIYFIKKYIRIVHVDKGLIPFNLWDFQEDIINKVNNNRFVICKMARQSGKALDIKTPILTTEGWKTFETLMVGDYVYGDDGKPTKITFITETMDNHECYDVSFSGMESIRADADHLWTVSYIHRKKGVIRTTKTTKELFELCKENKKSNKGVYIENNEPIDFPKTTLELDPYTFGCWLGDGNSSEYDDFYKTYEKYIDTSGFVYKKNNIHENKHIPREYMFNSVENRLSLLQGLMDTDGYCTPEGNCEFYQKREHIIESFVFLLRSLGINYTRSQKMINSEIYNIVRFTTTKYKMFRLHSKMKRQKKAKGKYEKIYISSIEPTKSVPVRCITVDNESHMFLAGKDLIPTHNSTTLLSYLLWYVLFNENVSVAILANKGATSRELLGRIQLAYEWIPKWLQQGIVIWNKGFIELANGSKILAESTSASSVRGRTFNCVMLDEFAFVPNKLANEFFQSTFPTISSGNSTKVLIVSTPKGMNLFYEMWSDAINGKNDYIPIDVNWQKVPGRDEEWKEMMIRNTSEEQFSQEFESVDRQTLIHIDGNETTIGKLYDELLSTNQGTVANSKRT